MPVSNDLVGKKFCPLKKEVQTKSSICGTTPSKVDFKIQSLA